MSIGRRPPSTNLSLHTQNRLSVVTMRLYTFSTDA